MSQLSLVLQETVRRGREATTLLEILRDTMDGGDVAERGGVERRPSFKQRLRLSGIGCCGAAWGIGRTVTIEDDPTEEQQQPQQHHQQQQQQQQLPQLSELIILARAATPQQNSDPGCFGPNPVQSGSGMNLAAALAAERQYREPLSEYTGGGDTSAPPATPMRVSLMRLLEETETDDVAGEGEKCGGGGGSDWVCCVCMGRKKGAAFIPCGHTFCRVCSREVWLNRGTCPLCNRTILEILDIF